MKVGERPLSPLTKEVSRRYCCITGVWAERSSLRSSAVDFGSLMERPMLGQAVRAAVQAKAVVVGDFRPFTDRSRLAGFDPNRALCAFVSDAL